MTSKDYIVIQLNKCNFYDIPYDDLRIIFSDSSNLSSIEILTEGNALCAIYEGYIKVDKYTIADEEISVQISKPNEIEQRLETVEDAVNILILETLEG